MTKIRTSYSNINYLIKEKTSSIGLRGRVLGCYADLPIGNRAANTQRVETNSAISGYAKAEPYIHVLPYPFAWAARDIF